MEILVYISSYFMIGIILSFIFDVLNNYLFHPDNPDKVQFDWFIRTINIFLWPYILGVFLRSMHTYYASREE